MGSQVHIPSATPSERPPLPMAETFDEPAPLAGRGTPLQICPRCESRAVARSRVRGFVRATAKRLLGIRPYRCLDCWHRFMAVSREWAATRPTRRTRERASSRSGLDSA